MATCSSTSPASGSMRESRIDSPRAGSSDAASFATSRSARAKSSSFVPCEYALTDGWPRPSRPAAADCDCQRASVRQRRADRTRCATGRRQARHRRRRSPSAVAGAGAGAPKLFSGAVARVPGCLDDAEPSARSISADAALDVPRRWRAAHRRAFSQGPRTSPPLRRLRVSLITETPSGMPELRPISSMPSMSKRVYTTFTAHRHSERYRSGAMYLRMFRKPVRPSASPSPTQAVRGGKCGRNRTARSCGASATPTGIASSGPG